MAGNSSREPPVQRRGSQSADNAAIRTFEDLECWKACRDLRIFISSRVVPSIPHAERFRLGDQLLRAARSTTANIAEGYGRFHYVDNAKFCSNASGSAWEVLDHLITGNDEGFLPPEVLEKGGTLVNRAVQLLNGYMRYLRRAETLNGTAPRVSPGATANRSELIEERDPSLSDNG